MTITIGVGNQPARPRIPLGRVRGAGSIVAGMTDSDQQRISVYEAVGGEPFFFAVVDRFYDDVLDSAVLRPLYPEDLGDARRHTALFLSQFWGGPPTYNEERGHPRLRMRHMPFAIGQVERDAWLTSMVAAVDHALESPPGAAPITHPTEGASIRAAVRQMFVDYLESASTAMINQPT
jgi:hemoglobin